jgi:hypothetical protein
MYSSSLPSFHLRYETEASTFAGLDVFGSLRSEMTERRTVRTFCVGFHLSQASSPIKYIYNIKPENAYRNGDLQQEDAK